MSQKDKIRINHEIKASEVRLIDPAGNQIGVVETREALRLADEKYGLDLVEISPTAKPPVCKLIDAGKYKYQLKKRAQEAKKNQSVVQLKEIKFRPQTDKHDVEFKIKHIQRFLAEGNKTKLTVFFKGREMAYKELGIEMLQKIYDQLNEIASIEQQPKAEGRYLTMIIAPKREWLESLEKEKEKEVVSSEKSKSKEKDNA